LENAGQVADLGLRDYADSHVLVIEWIERAEGLISPTISVRLGFAGAGREAEVA
jgi:tRNA A37 threonylcarbamoyladenosine biosynthesis protein TsaE